VTHDTLIQRSKSGGRPTLQESEVRLQRLLDVAQRQFLTAGYRETSLEGIAREAGVAKKTLYDRFGSKAGLFGTIMRGGRDSLKIRRIST
jgi:TetR/AcrR family transcriptional repressor of mexJK operon